nr:sec14 cytosolic factor [Quercus suber]
MTSRTMMHEVGSATISHSRSGRTKAENDSMGGGHETLDDGAHLNLLDRQLTYTVALSHPLQYPSRLYWPTGHEGHITAGQQATLERFKTLCLEKGYYTPANPDRKSAASHDDETMLRYLRARKFIPQDAFGQFKETEDWRKENKLDTLYETIDIDDARQRQGQHEKSHQFQSPSPPSAIVCPL